MSRDDTLQKLELHTFYLHLYIHFIIFLGFVIILRKQERERVDHRKEEITFRWKFYTIYWSSLEYNIEMKFVFVFRFEV